MWTRLKFFCHWERNCPDKTHRMTTTPTQEMRKLARNAEGFLSVELAMLNNPENTAMNYAGVPSRNFDGVDMCEAKRKPHNNNREGRSCRNTDI